MKKTKKNYEDYLNACSPQQGSSQWIIGGSIRINFMWAMKYGSALRKYDPKAFEVGFKEWKREVVC